MSIEIDISFPSVRLPSPKAWQDAINENGFAVELDCDFDPETFSGFLPARYEGEAAGFEYYHCPEPDGRCLVSLRWSANAREGASAIIAAGCLCHLTGGELRDSEEGVNVPSTAALSWARQNEAEFKAAARQYSDDRTPHSSPQRPWWKVW